MPFLSRFSFVRLNQLTRASTRVYHAKSSEETEVTSIMAYYCPNCGLELRSGENFCPNCGTPLSGAANSSLLHTAETAAAVGGVILGASALSGLARKVSHRRRSIFAPPPPPPPPPHGERMHGRTSPHGRPGHFGGPDGPGHRGGW